MSRVWDSLLRGFGRSIGWKLGALALAALLALVSAGNAKAALPIGSSTWPASGCHRTTSGGTDVYCAGQGVAYKACMVSKEEATTKGATGASCNYTSNATVGTYACMTASPGGYCTNAGGGSVTTINSSDMGGTFRHQMSKSCAAEPNLTAGYIRGSKQTPTVCKDGCQFTKQGSSGYVVVDFGSLGEGWTTSVAGYAATGQTCQLDANLPKPEGQEDCIPIEGQSVCKSKEGKLCYSASTGRRICWASGETGQKTDGNLAQVSNVGSQPQPPNIGQPTQPSGQTPITTTTTTTNNTTTNTTVVTTSNHTTTNGSPAGSTNTGEGTDANGYGTGTGGSTGGTGAACGGSGQPACPPDNTSTGGADCEAPPTSGGDPLLVQVAHQGWRAACSGEAMDDKLRDDAGTLEGATPGVGEGDSIFSDAEGNEPNINTTMLGGGGACPVSGTYEIAEGVSFSVPPQFCDTIAALRWLFLTIAYAWALRILV